MLKYVLLGVLIGIGLTILYQEAAQMLSDYRDRKQQEFEAIVASRNARKKDHDPDGCGCHASWEEHERFMMRATTSHGGVAGSMHDDPAA